ncbi:AAA family ATPase [Micromonospora sp. NPDC051196]|uniref:AAA family ATPase n=1 Tax=Micromonospora sp. NPDC051196 TaxID=3155281 RepID=UPI00343B8A73
MLLGRETEISELRSTLDECVRRQRSQVVLLTGAVGSGKSSVLDAFGRDLMDGPALFLTSRGAAGAYRRFGVIDRLLAGVPISPATKRWIADQLGDPTSAGPLPEPGDPITTSAGSDERVHGAVLQEISTALLEHAARRPVVIAVDDVHAADSASLHTLLYVVRRLRYAQAVVMMLLTESSTVQPRYPLFRAELLSQPHTTRLVLPPLRHGALARMAGAVTPDAAAAWADECLTLTGGNPILAQALLESRTNAGPESEARFRRAVLDSLRRHEQVAREVAEALAVLDGPVPVELLSQVLDVDPAVANRALRVLAASGLVQNGQLRQQVMRRSILADMAPERRQRLHERAAATLDEHGAEPGEVAGHLLAADRAEADWAVTALQESAAQSLALGRPELASAYLGLAERAVPTGERRVDITAMRLTARWQMNPLDAAAELADLVDDAEAAVPFLLWQGRFDEVDRLVGPSAPADAPGSARLLSAVVRPGNSPHRETWTRKVLAAGPPLASHAAREALTVLATSLLPEAHCDVTGAAEQVLQRHHADGGSIGPLTAPLMALIWAGRADRAAAWADVLLVRPPLRPVSSWHSVLLAIRAEAALRLGDLRGARQYAHQAWDAMPQAWGVAGAGPLATLIQGATATNRADEARRWVAVPVTPGMFETPLGLQYLGARAAHRLAMGQPDEAEADLLRCRDLMTAWRTDIAGIVSWRVELARVRLSVGDVADARRLLRDELDRSGAVDHRTRGRALRLLAATSPPEERRVLLSDAVTHLQRVGDRMELAMALADTGRRLLTVREPVRARRLFRRAFHLAEECGATPLTQQLLREEPGVAEPKSRNECGVDVLSEAERRVATLAAQGQTNRQISEQLFITVSTVEQHLTKAFRKLNVKRRAELAARLVGEDACDRAAQAG